MTTNNIVNVSLSGQTGTGSFAGSDSPVFTTNISTPNLQFTANTITATNSGGSINFQISTTGVYNFKGSASTAGEMRLFENTGNGTTYVGLKSAESVSSSVTFTLPTADGSNGQALTTNGSTVLSFNTITGSGGLSGVHYYTAGTTWNKPAGISHAYVLCVGGGGAGGSAVGSGKACGGGGGSGSYGWSYIAAASLSSSETVTIGAGGTPGATGNHAGGNGGTTSFGSHISAGGGNGGGGSAALTPPALGGSAGTGGTCTSADINIPGNDGSPGVAYSSSINAAGAGGVSPYGVRGDYNWFPDEAGMAATGYGAGGSGGGQFLGSTAYAGGAGAPGLCLVYEYS